jgi:hypothetical protein
MAYENYLRLCETVRHIEEKRQITEDWMEEHKCLIHTYRDVFPNISKVNEDTEDSEFRTRARAAEPLLAQLINEIRRTNTFGISIYWMLCVHLKRMTEMAGEEDDLMDGISSMSITNVANRM